MIRMKKVFVLILCVFSADGAYEGDLCDLNGTSGTCVKISKCPKALDDIKNRRPIQNCGYGADEPIVCCAAGQVTTTKKPVLTTTKRTPSTTTTEYIPPVYDYVEVGDKSAGGCGPISPLLTSPKNGIKAWDKCLEYQELVFPCSKTVALTGGMSRANRCKHNADKLIVGGSDAGVDEFPHMALLGYGDDESSISWLCGGALISDNFVLTAGHCISSRKNNVSYVLLGAYRRSDDISGRNRYKVQEIIKHPNYNSPDKYHDIALLRLEKKVPLSEFLVPACLYTGDPIEDNRASAAGWGDTKYKGSNSDILQKVVLTKFDTLECALKYPPSRHMENGFDDNTQYCYGDRTMSKDTCQGDSGGPLHVKSKKIACMYVIIGVTSFGRACGFVGDPGIYTRVVHYLDWIENIVWP